LSKREGAKIKSKSLVLENADEGKQSQGEAKICTIKTASTHKPENFGNPDFFAQ